MKKVINKIIIFLLAISAINVYATSNNQEIPERGYGYVDLRDENTLNGKDEKNNDSNTPKINLKKGLKNVLTSNIQLPSKYDSRDVNGVSYVTSAKRQFGETCWAYSLTSVIESKLLKDGLENDASTLDLSERMMDYATSDPLSTIDIEKNPYFGKYSFNALNDGGNEERYESALVNGIFPIAENKWNYIREYMGKVKPEDIYDLSKSQYQVNEMIILNDNNSDGNFDEETNKIIKQYLMDNGSIGMSVGTHYSVFYYHPEEPEQLLNNGSYHNRLFYKDANAKIKRMDHMVAIIGWDDTYTHSVCITDDGLLEDSEFSNNSYICRNGTLKELHGAWIVKNSDDDISSYNYVAYETFNSNYFVITDISRKNWDNVYSINNDDIYENKADTYTFKKKNNQEKIQSIKFLFSNYFASRVEIDGFDVYLDIFDGNGERLLTTIQKTYAGLYTIPVTDNNIISGDRFSIRIQPKNMDKYIGINYMSVFTSNNDDNIVLDIDDTKVVNSFNYQSLLDEYDSLVVLNGTSRNVNSNITYVIKNSNDVDVTNQFNIIRNYAVGNYVNTIIRFKKNVPLGKYTGYAYINDKLYSTFKIDIDFYMEKISGDGSIDNPYIISNSTQLDMIRLNKYSFYKLGNDIDLTYDTHNKNGLFYNNGLGWEPISYSSCTNYNRFYCYSGFMGGLDGNNYKIKGLFINRPEEDAVGLFRNTYNDNYSALHFRNIVLENVDITGKDYVGALVGYAYGVTYERTLLFENISVSGKVTGKDNVGGIIGYFDGGTDQNNYLLDGTSCTSRHCLNSLFNSADVSGDNHIGGIIGLLSTQDSDGRSNIDAYNWQNNGTISAINEASGLIGNALIQKNNKITLTNAINTGIANGSQTSGIVYNSECKDNTSCSLILNNVYYTNDLGYNANNIITANNVKKYSITDLTNDNIYNSFNDFTTYFKKETIDGIKRIPFLKNAKITYTNVSDITLDNEIVNIYDYLTGSKNINYEIQNNSIAVIDEKGNITPKASGNTTISVISNYDGFTKDVPLVVLNVSNVNISFNANGGVGSMNSITGNLGDKIVIPVNTFTNNNLYFKQWNTKADGTGLSYKSGDSFTLKGNTVLYAIWSENNITNINANDVQPSTYIIGNYMFTRDVTSDYDGVLTTQKIMLAARHLTSNNEKDMIIYYKKANGNWIDALSGSSISVPNSFEIEVTNLDKIINSNVPQMSLENYSSNNVAASTYIIGNYMFTRNINSNYNGVLTTQRIMLASKTLTGGKEQDMVIYYKKANGSWINALTGLSLSVPSTFKIGNIDLSVIN